MYLLRGAMLSFFENRNNVACFYNVRKYCCDNLREKYVCEQIRDVRTTFNNRARDVIKKLQT
jgi:hypothetical protein